MPGVPDAHQLVVVTRRKGRDTSLEEFWAAQRTLEGAEWEAAAAVLADKRKSRVGLAGREHREVARHVRHRRAHAQRRELSDHRS